MNLGQTVEKHEEEHILTVEDHQEKKQRAMRQKKGSRVYRLPCPGSIYLVANFRY